MKRFHRCSVAVTAMMLTQPTIGESLDAVPYIGPPYIIPDKYFSDSVAETQEEAIAIWWDKYRQYFGVSPYGDLSCGYEFRPGEQGTLGSLGRVHVNGECKGSDLVKLTVECGPDFELQGDLCVTHSDYLDEREPDDECESTGHPVNFTTGNKHLKERDIVPLGSSILALTRTWNSYDGRWRHSYSQYLQIHETSAREAVVYRENGGVVRFRDGIGGWRAPAGSGDSLREVSEGYLFTLSTGHREWFDASGRLTRVAYTNGRVVTVRYDTEDEVLVSDEYGNEMRIVTSPDGRLAEVRDENQARYRYRYADGRLVHVSYPDATPGAAGGNPFGEDNPYRTYHYEDAHNPALVTGITDENGDRHKTILYNENGRAIRSSLGAGDMEQTRLDLDYIQLGTDRRTVAHTPTGGEIVYHLEAAKRDQKVVELESVETQNCPAFSIRHTYGPDTGWLKRTIDGNGNVTEYDYFDDQQRYGLLRSRTEAVGTAAQRRFAFDWDMTTRLPISETLEGQYRIEYAYGPGLRLASETHTDLGGDAQPYATAGRARTWQYGYEWHDGPAQTRLSAIHIDGPRNDVADITTYRFNERGFLTDVVDAVGNTTRFGEHNNRGQPGFRQDANGVLTRLTYHPRGWLLQSEHDPSGESAVTRFGYDAVGQLVSITSPEGRTTRYRYDEGHRMTAGTDPLGREIRVQRDSGGKPARIEILDADAHIVADQDLAFDEAGRPLRILGSYGRVTGFDYDANDNLIAIAHDGGRVTYREFDARDNLVLTRFPDGSEIRIGYDAADRVASVTDQRGLVTTYHRDGLGSLKQIISPDTGTTVFNTDSAGNVVSSIDARGVETQFRYDALNRLEAKEYPALPGDNRYFFYDNGAGCTTCSNRVRAIRDASGEQRYHYNRTGQPTLRQHYIEHVGPAPVEFDMRFNYDRDGLLTKVRYPGGSAVEYRRDAAGQVSAVTRRAPDGTLQSIARAITYQPFGRTTGLEYGNGLQLLREYDLDGRLTRNIVADRLNLSYSYDASGNISHVDNLLRPSRSQQFDYDLLNRLAYAASGNGTIEYTYDDAGNRRHRNITTAHGVIAEEYSYLPGTNRLIGSSAMINGSPQTRGFTHDPAGNLIREIDVDGPVMNNTYDANNRLIGITR